MGFIMICIALHYHVKGAFVIALISCSIIWWWYTNTWPPEIASFPAITEFHNDVSITTQVMEQWTLILELTFLYAVTLNGLGKSMGDLAGITRADGSLPRGRWLYVLSGVMSLFSGYISGPPILISPESGAGIKAGARSGLSAVFAGLWFLLATFFTPLFRAVPHAGERSVCHL